MKRWVFVTVLLYVVSVVLVISLYAACEEWRRVLGGEMVRLLLEMWHPTNNPVLLLPVVAAVMALFLAAPAADAGGDAVKRRHVNSTLASGAFVMAVLTSSILFCAQDAIFGERFLDSWVLWLEGGSASEVVFFAGVVLLWVAWFVALLWFTRRREVRRWIGDLTLCIFVTGAGAAGIGIMGHVKAENQGRDSTGALLTAVYGMCALLLSFGPAVFYRLGARRERTLAGRKDQEEKTS